MNVSKKAFFRYPLAALAVVGLTIYALSHIDTNAYISLAIVGAAVFLTALLVEAWIESMAKAFSNLEAK